MKVRLAKQFTAVKKLPDNLSTNPVTEHKICLVGLDNAGKTTILYQFLMNEVVHTSPTIGSNVEEVGRRTVR
jgi:GTPase SAR1 family protein